MIVVLGSVNMDRIHRVDHLPELGETVVSSSEIFHPGGKGATQAITALKMGAEVYFMGSIGQDEVGSVLLENFQRYGMDISGVKLTSTLSGCADVTVDRNGMNTIVYVPGANCEAKASQIPECFLNQQTIVLIQMEITPIENWILVHRAKRNGAKVILNAAPVVDLPKDIIKSIDIIITNSTEARILANFINLGTDDCEEIAKRISQKYNNTCIITMGEDGVVAVSMNEVTKVPAIDVLAVDTTAAGDAFIGTFTAYLDKGYSFEDCILAGNIAGGLATTKKGTQVSIPTLQEVQSVFRQIKEQKHMI